MKAKFITVVGGEGSGKDTVVSVLKKSSLGNCVVFTREPGGTPFAEVVRTNVLKHPLASQASPAAIMCGMFMSRFDNTENLIVPALTEGSSVVCNRYDACTYAYQVIAGKARKQLEGAFWDLRYALPVKPDLYVFLRVDPATGLTRARSRNLSSKDGNHFDEADLEFHTRVRDGYQDFFGSIPQRSMTIDANQPLETVTTQFLEVIGKELTGLR